MQLKIVRLHANLEARNLFAIMKLDRDEDDTVRALSSFIKTQYLVPKFGFQP